MRVPERRRFGPTQRAAVFIVALALGLTACAGDSSDSEDEADADVDESADDDAAADEGDEEQGDAEGAVEPEGVLEIHAAPNDANRPIGEAFMERYPNVEVTWSERSAGAMVERYRTESRAGASTADIIFGAQGSFMRSLVEEGLLDEAESTNFDMYPDDQKGEPYWVNVRPGFYAIMYNTNLVDANGFTSWRDFVNDDFHNQLAIQDPRISSAWYESFVGMWHEDSYGEEFFETLAALEPGVIEGGGAQYQAVASGEYAAAIFLPMYHWFNGEARGDPVRAFFPEEGVGLGILGVAVAKDAPNPVAAQAFWDWITSVEGQDHVQEHFAFSANTEVPEREGGVEVPEFPRLVDFSADVVVDADQDEWLARFDEIFGRG